MDMGKRSGRLNSRGEAEYYVTVDDVVLLASKAGVAITKKIAQEWLEDPAHRQGIEAAINVFVMQSLSSL